jgi:predicted TIM-barrel fold metal-dependent hydrolase
MDLKLQVPFPPDPNPRKPKFKLPPGTWDTHFHAYGPPQVFPYADDRNFTPAAAPIEHYFKLAAFLGFERGVIAQSSVHGDDDLSVTLDAIKKSDGRLLGMVRANPDYDPDDIRRLHAAGIRAMRVTLAGNLHGKYDEKSFAKIVKLAAVKSWVVALHVDPKSILEIADVVRKMPVQTIVENYAQMDARKGVDQPALRMMVDLAKEPHVWIKNSSAYKMLYRGGTYEQVVPIARAVAAASPDRSIWGTDWPHSGAFEVGMVPNDGDIVNWLLDFVPDETARNKMLADNPKRLFDSI